MSSTIRPKIALVVSSVTRADLLCLDDVTRSGKGSSAASVAAPPKPTPATEVAGTVTVTPGGVDETKDDDTPSWTGVTGP